MGNSKNSKCKQNKGKKQIHGDSRKNRKVSKPEINRKHRESRSDKKYCLEHFIKHYEEITGLTIPYTQLKNGEIKRPWAKIRKLVESDVKLQDLLGEHQVQKQTSITEQEELKQAEHMKWSAQDMVAVAAMTVEMTDSMTKPLEDMFLKDDKMDQDLHHLPVDASSNALLVQDSYHFSLDDLSTDDWLHNFTKENAGYGAGTSTGRASIAGAECQDNGLQ